MPSGNQLRAGRILAGVEQAQLARDARIDPSTLSRMEGAGKQTVRGRIDNVESVIKALERHGVQLTEDGGVRPKPRR
jgi:transcriptional regulator with XRE-family HTH domain